MERGLDPDNDPQRIAGRIACYFPPNGKLERTARMRAGLVEGALEL